MGPYHHTNHDLLDHGILSDDDLAQFPEDLLVPMLEFFYERCIVGDDLLDVFHPQTPPFFEFLTHSVSEYRDFKGRCPLTSESTRIQHSSRRIYRPRWFLRWA